MKTAWKLLLLILVVLAAFIWYRHASAPDVQLGKRLAPMCDIFRDNVATPERGVDALFGFFGENTPDLLRDFGRLLVEIERIPEDERHDDRARLAARRIRAPLEACGADVQRFAQAVSENEAANEKLERGSERVSRAIVILFSGHPEHTRGPLGLLPRLSDGLEGLARRRAR